MKKRKFLLNTQIDFNSNDSDNLIKFIRLPATLGQYNIRDNESELPSLIKDFLLNFLLKPSKKKISNNLFLKDTLLPVEIFFEEEESSVFLYYPNFNFNFKKIIELRKKEFFLKIELFKLTLISRSNRYLSLQLPYEEGEEKQSSQLFSFNFLSSSLYSIHGVLLSFRKHLFFKSRKINFRRKNVII